MINKETKCLDSGAYFIVPKFQQYSAKVFQQTKHAMLSESETGRIWYENAC